MAKNILDLISEKDEKRMKGKTLAVRDVNQDLIVALTAIPVYGKVTRDEEILSIIINAGCQGLETTLDEIRSAYQEKLKKKEIKKGKDGFFRNKQGFIVLSHR